ncbi:hypothetical protein [Thalassomonas sp. RHCl1]|uniref:hypothetical protein n=1 Tax=Thalassomonas sp. RHCl1 TaxID=2995320 RepID=UPI00248ABE62|nr:hypothetical protein [Thalassomonas sp. RHCl1]
MSHSVRVYVFICEQGDFIGIAVSCCYSYSIGLNAGPVSVMLAEQRKINVNCQQIQPVERI